MLSKFIDSDDDRLKTAKSVGLYVVGLLFILNGIGLLAFTYAAGVLVILAGVFVFPRTRTAIEQRSGITLSRLVTVGVFALLYLTATSILLIVVELDQAPDYVVPF
jgi:hypothetical protein